MRLQLLVLCFSCAPIVAGAQSVDEAIVEDIQRVIQSVDTSGGGDVEQAYCDKAAYLERVYRGSEREMFRAFVHAHPMSDELDDYSLGYMAVYSCFTLPVDMRLRLLVAELIGTDEKTQHWAKLLIGALGGGMPQETYWGFLKAYLKQDLAGQTPEMHDALIEALISLDAKGFVTHCVDALIDDPTRHREVRSHLEALSDIGGGYSEVHFEAGERMRLSEELLWFTEQPEWWLRMFAARYMDRWTPVEIPEVVSKLESDPDPRVRKLAEELKENINNNLRAQEEKRQRVPALAQPAEPE